MYAHPPIVAPPVKKSGGVLKILLVVGAIFVVLIGVAVAGLVYVGIRAKNALDAAAEQHGIPLGDLASNERGSLRGANPCSFLTAAEAGQILRVSIVRTETERNKCSYFASPTAANSAKTANSLEQLKAAKGTEQEKQELERYAKAIAAPQNPGSVPYLTIEYAEDGRTHMAGVKIAAGAVGEFEKITGVGDEAMVGPLGSIFVFLYKGIAVEMDLRQVPEGRDRGIQLAKKITPRM
jgi:hypothetical protein